MKYFRMFSFICVCLLVFIIHLYSQASDTLWTKSYGVKQEFYSVRQTSDGGYIISGAKYPVALSMPDLWLVKTNADGDTLWTRRYGGSASDIGFSVQQTSDGGYIVAGQADASSPPPVASVYLVKTDSDGDTIWTKKYGGSAYDLGYAVEQTSDGGYIITGLTTSFGAGVQDIYIIKTDSDGDTIWTKVYGGQWEDDGRSVHEVGTQSDYIIGGARTIYNNQQFYLMKIDSDGDSIWAKAYGGALPDRCFSIEPITNGYIAVGWRYAGSPVPYRDIYFMKTDTNGDTLWTKVFGGTDHDAGRSCEVTDDGGYIIAGETASFGSGGIDAYILKTDSDGDTLWTRTYGGQYNDHSRSIKQTADHGYIAAGDLRPTGGDAESWLIRLTPDGLETDDANSLAYNGNRHLVRKPNTAILHIAYTMEGCIIYSRSTNGGTSWDDLENLGEGESPAIWLDHDGNPCVTWTHADTLCYSRKTSSWTRTNYAFGTANPSHPCIMVIPPATAIPDSVHIVFRYHIPLFSYNAIREFTFSTSNPQSYQTRNLDVSFGMNMVTLDFPSSARDYLDTLHVTWMHGDTVHYATRGETESSWNDWGWQFVQNGVNSNHPFAETYGDSVFVVWQNESDDEVWRASRLLGREFRRWNLSQTSETPSLYPVNASGLVTTFVDKSSEFNAYDIFWKTYPGQTLHNLSGTSTVRSIFPHASLAITPIGNYQYTIWQEGNASPYEIQYERITINPTPSPAYFTSIAGFENASLYLVERDSFISSWQIPVDVGYDEVSYQFSLEPDYDYILEAIAYHEKEDKWKSKIIIDGEEVSEIEYEAFEPETLECSICPVFYSDSIIDVSFECDDGDFAAIGPVYIYRFENEGGKDRGGSQMIQLTQNHPTRSTTVSLSPNPFRARLDIKYVTPENSRISVKIYDVSGRLVKQTNLISHSSTNKITWNGDDNAGQPVAQGVYFLRFENLDTKESVSRKLLRLR